MIQSSWFLLIIFGLASFRLTRLIVSDSITAFIRKPFHNEVEMADDEGNMSTYIQIKGTGIRAWIGELLSCYWCTGVWCSFVLYLTWLMWPFVVEPVIIVLAIAGIAGIIESIITKILD
ncbi:sporulation protein [Heyndrickxia sporothermodurans]|uniref:DUF1360 domain-containing protein n=1 Tax=Heyndrickxia sporothermodurans TaxID=46224 RepID=UPI000D3D3400|nr:DUF1360 domain-containing protein [Heyndrickxia sporothermodurans]PTY76381.1 sporulation protein [Heyndrickxia sporothermodurans]